MATPTEAHHEEFERTDALPKLDLNVLADATPINSDLLTRTDSWTFESLQDLRWPRETDFNVFGSRPAPRIDTSKLTVEDGLTDMLTPLELGLPETADAATRTLAFEAAAPEDPDAVQAIAAALEQEIVLFAEEHVGSTPVGTLEPQLEKAQALRDLPDLAILLDTEAAATPAAANDAPVEDAITWVDIPEEFTPASLAEGAHELQRLLHEGEADASVMARNLALKLMDGDALGAGAEVETLELDPRSFVQALFPRSHTEQQAELLTAQQMIEELRESNGLLQEAIATAQQRVEFLKSDVEQRTEIANARDSQLATSIEELTSRRLAMRELERVIQARDEVIAGLRAELEAVRIELQTAKDERGIMAINLGKTRERAKLLRQQLLEKNTLLQSMHADPAEPTQTLARRSGHDVQLDLPARLLVPIDHGGSTIPLDRPMLTVGRTPQTDICIPSTLISRQHARLIVTTEAVVVEDLNSTNGCFVNDRRIQKKMVREGDIVTLADMKYRLSERHPEGMLND